MATTPYIPSGDCGVPDTPANGSKSVSFTTVGHTVTYTCKSEYKLLGSSSRICQNNGQWSGTQPSCSRKLYDVCYCGSLLLQSCTHLVSYWFHFCTWAHNNGTWMEEVFKTLCTLWVMCTVLPALCGQLADSVWKHGCYIYIYIVFAYSGILVG